MHELSVAMNLLTMIKEIASQNNLYSVTKVTVQAGELTAIVPDNLKFYFDQLKKDSSVRETELVIEVIPLQAYCNKCGSFLVKNLNFSCPQCGETKIKVTQGEELCLYQLEGESNT